MEPYESQPSPEQDLFDNNPYHLVQASGGKRFVNYLVDRIVFYIAFYLIVYFIASMGVNLTINIDPNSAGFAFINLIVYVIAYSLYMGLMEFALKGKSIGKFLTGTRAVKQDGTHLELKDALLRGLCRIIPFNVFSALGNPSYPWHDSIPKTYVIDERQSEYPG